MRINPINFMQNSYLTSPSRDNQIKFQTQEAKDVVSFSGRITPNWRLSPGMYYVLADGFDPERGFYPFDDCAATFHDIEKNQLEDIACHTVVPRNAGDVLSDILFRFGVHEKPCAISESKDLFAGYLWSKIEDNKKILDEVMKMSETRRMRLLPSAKAYRDFKENIKDPDAKIRFMIIKGPDSEMNKLYAAMSDHLKNSAKEYMLIDDPKFTIFEDVSRWYAKNFDDNEFDRSHVVVALAHEPFYDSDAIFFANRLAERLLKNDGRLVLLNPHPKNLRYLRETENFNTDNTKFYHIPKSSDFTKGRVLLEHLTPKDDRYFKIYAKELGSGVMDVYWNDFI